MPASLRIDPSAALLEQSVLRITTAEGQTLGTGFAIGPHTILTCHHVVDGFADFRIPSGGARPWHGTLQDDADLASFDLALISCDGPLPSLLPIAVDPNPPAAYESRGFHLEGAGFTSALPLRGTVVGPTSLDYRRYAIEAWALSGMNFGPGMSGAPIVDRETGVVVGVISTMVQGGGALTGTGIPLDLPAASTDRLRQALDENSALVPRFGRHLNVAGARALLDDHADRIARGYEDRGIYLPERAVPRTSLDGVLEYLVESDRTVLPIIGMAGSGKTTFVARLATSREHPVLVIPGLAIRDPNGALDVLGQRAIDQTRLAPGKRPSFDTLLQVIADGGSPPIIVVEGLNEAGISPADMRDLWLPTSAEIARRMGAKLVITCRPEYWAELGNPLSKSLLCDGVGMLGEFTDDELADAAARYGIDASRGALTKVFRLPLMLRVLSELGSGSDAPQQLRRTQAIDQFVERRAIAVANRIPNRPPTSLVRNTLKSLAGELFNGGTLDLDRTRYDQVTQPPPELGWALFKENLLFESGSTVRFTFDEIAEFLIAETVGLKALDAPTIGSLDSATTPLSAPLVSQLLRRGYDTGDSSLASTVAALARASTDDAFIAPLALRNFLVAVPDVQRFLPAVQLLVEQAADVSAKHSLLRRWTFDILGQSNLEPRDALRLTRRVMPTEDGYEMRDKDRGPDGPRHAMGKIGTTLEEIVARGGVPALDELAGWLADETRMADQEATIGSVAAMIVANAQPQWERSTVEAVAAAENYRAADLIEGAYRRKPNELAELCADWMENRARGPQFILTCVNILADQSVDRAIPLYRRLSTLTDDPNLKTTINERLLKHGAASEDQVEQLIEAVADGTGTIHPVESLLIDRWDAIERALLRRVDAMSQRGYDSGGIPALGWVTLPAAIEQRIATMLKELYESEKLDAYTVAQTLEGKLNRVDPALAESTGYVDLAVALAGASSDSARRCIAYVAFPTRPDPQRRGIEARLREALVAAARDAESIGTLLQVARETPGPIFGALLDELMPRLGHDERDRRAFELLMETRGESEPLVRWVVAHAGEMGRHTSIFLRFLNAGQPAKDAINAAVDEVIGDR